MKNASSEERYNFEVWYVLDKINYEIMRNKKDKIFRYMIYPNILSKQEVSFIRQQEILKMLEDEGAIIKREGISGTKDADVLERGKKGTSRYHMFLIHYFEPTDKFNGNYKKYKRLVSNTHVKNGEERNNTSVQQNNQSNKKKNDFALVYALKLFLNGDRLCFVGSVIKNKTIELRKITSGTGSLIEPVLKVCKSHPYTFKTITLSDLRSKTDMQSKSLDESTKKISLFKGYLSNIGLKRDLRDLFFANSPEGLRFKFRTMVSLEEWSKLSPNIRKNIVNMLNKKAVLKE